MRVLALAAMLLGGCDLVFGTDRIPSSDAEAQADARGDANLTPHDEDADGFTDGFDNCPVNAQPNQLDGDVDNVGDACDPHPTNPGDRIALFDSFFSGAHSPWTVTGSAAAGTDDYALKYSVGALQYTATFAAPTARIHFTDQTLSSDTTFVGVFIGEWNNLSPANGLLCDSYWNASTLYMRATLWVGGSSSTTVANPVVAAGSSSNFAISAHFDTGLCAGAFDNATVTANAGAPPAVASPQVVIAWQNTGATLASAIVYDR